MRLTTRRLLFKLVNAGVFLALLLVITNLALALYEADEKYAQVEKRLASFRSYFDKYENISFAIAYSLRFYSDFATLPTIYVITPSDTKRPTQLSDLTRMRNTLWLVPKIVWIVVEDASRPSSKLATFLAESHINHVHLSERTPDEMAVQSTDKAWSKPRGVFQRNKALAWLRDNAARFAASFNSVIYFADDDNTYDIRLFEEMRYTRKVSVWPVAFVGELMYERPICRSGRVVGWFGVWGKKRPFPIDMAGFAVNLNLLLAHPSASFTQFVPRGMQESHFLGKLVATSDLEARADNCTKIYVWHTNTRQVLLSGEKHLPSQNLSYDEHILRHV